MVNMTNRIKDGIEQKRIVFFSGKTNLHELNNLQYCLRKKKIYNSKAKQARSKPSDLTLDYKLY